MLVMTQQHQPPPPLPSSTYSLMGEHSQIQSQSQIQIQTQNQTQIQSQIQSPAQIQTQTENQTPEEPLSTPANSSKISFRPKKIRKLSNADNAQTDAAKSITVRRPPPPQIIARTLSQEGEIAVALRHLRAADPNLARVIDLYDPPAFQNLHPPFHSLTRSILYQQLAFKAAASIYSRFLALCGGETGVVPHAVLALTPHQLRQIGVSGRKASYLHDLASKYCRGILSDSSIVDMDDKSLSAMLTMVKGIGAWSVHMFMIFSLHRPDVLPVGDLGVRKGVQILYGLEELPRPSQMERLCERWRPYRSVGSWYMWRLVEARGAPVTGAAAAGLSSQQQQQQQVPLQVIDPMNGIANLG